MGSVCFSFHSNGFSGHKAGNLWAVEPEACWRARHWSPNSSWSWCWMCMDAYIPKFWLVTVSSQAFCARQGWPEKHSLNLVHFICSSIDQQQQQSVLQISLQQQTGQRHFEIVRLKGKFKVVNDQIFSFTLKTLGTHWPPCCKRVPHISLILLKVSPC